MQPVAVPAAPPVVMLRMTVRVDDLDTFVTRYARHLDGDRIFIFTRTTQPVGTPVRFGLYLTNGELILQGRGTVVRIQEPSANTRRPPGLELQFVPTDERSKTLVEFMQAIRSESKLNPPVGDGAPIQASAAPPLPENESTLAMPASMLPGAPGSKPKLTSPAAVLVAAARAAKDAPRLPPPPPMAAAASPPAAAPALPPAILTPMPTPPPIDRKVAVLPPGAPAADPAIGLPANPFSEIPDGAIEYFVEWSLEQNTGSGIDTKAVFGNVGMTLPSPEPEPLPSHRPAALLIGGVFLAGAIAGAIVYRAVLRPAPPVVAASPPLAAPEPGARAPAPAPVAAAKPSAAVEPAPAPTPVAAARPVPAPAAAPAPEPAAPPSPGPKATGAAPLTIRSTPPGATVYLDGNRAGTTPVSLEVRAGSHQLRLKRERYMIHEAAVSAPAQLDVALRRPIATLSVRTTPPGATVQIGKGPSGRTPADLKLPAFESYNVRVTFADGRVARKQLYLIPPGQSVNANLPAAAKPARR